MEPPQIYPRLVDLFEAIGNTKDSANEKLGPNWEGSYKITMLANKGDYHLEDPNGRQLSRPWSCNNLKKYYQ